MNESFVVRTWTCILFVLSVIERSVQYNDVLLPPKFPDLLSYFAESLSASEDLRQLSDSWTTELSSSDRCRCGPMTKVNWTQFNSDIGSYVLPFDSACLPSDDAPPQSSNAAAISLGQVERRNAIIIGICICAGVIAVFAAVFIAVRRYRCIQRAWHVLKRKSLSIRRQRSDCEPTLNSDDNRRRNVVEVSANDDNKSSSSVGCCCEISSLKRLKNILFPAKAKNETDAARAASSDASSSSHDVKTSAPSRVGRDPGGIETFDESSMPVGKLEDNVSSETAEKLFSDVSGEGMAKQKKNKNKKKKSTIQSMVNNGDDAAAWTILQSRLQFLCDNNEELVNRDNINLFSYDSVASINTPSTQI